jgi:hypothetical protein
LWKKVKKRCGKRLMPGANLPANQKRFFTSLIGKLFLSDFLHASGGVQYKSKFLSL